MKKVVYTAQEEQQLMSHLLNPELANDPYKWVMAVFPWGEKGKPLARFKGPRKWQIAVLKRIAKHIWEGKTLTSIVCCSLHGCSFWRCGVVVEVVLEHSHWRYCDHLCEQRGAAS